MATDFAAQSGHWYCPKTGEPRYTITKKDGNGTRATTIRDARLHGFVPSVTTIIRCAAKPGLERWKVSQALDAAMKLPKLPDESEEAFKDRAWQESERMAREAAERGTSLHASLEAYFKGGKVPAEHVPHADKVSETLLAHGLTGPWEAERSFASDLGFGGKLDLSAANCVLDFKSKPRIEDGKLLAYDEHCIQLAAYAYGLHRPDARLVNVFVGLEDVKVALVEWSPREAERGWKMFQLLLDYWKLANNFAAMPQKEAA
jgi:hypothetical protein